MNYEEQSVKAVPEAIRNRPTPQSTLFKSAPESMKKQVAAATRRNACTTNGDVARSTEGST